MLHEYETDEAVLKHGIDDREQLQPLQAQKPNYHDAETQNLQMGGTCLARLSDIHIIRGIDELNGEALRVISLSPAWTPGYENGKPVPETINFPIYFQLPDE